MANITGQRVYGSAATLHSGAGRVLGILISHDQATAQAVTLYDNTAASGTVLARFWVAPERCPFYLRLDHSGEPAPFSAGLTVDPGNCEVNVWSSG